MSNDATVASIDLSFMQALPPEALVLLDEVHDRFSVDMSTWSLDDARIVNGRMRWNIQTWTTITTDRCEVRCIEWNDDHWKVWELEPVLTTFRPSRIIKDAFIESRCRWKLLFTGTHVNVCNGSYVDFQGLRRPCTKSEGCSLHDCPRSKL